MIKSEKLLAVRVSADCCCGRRVCVLCQSSVSRAISTVERRRGANCVHVTAISQSQDRISASTAPAIRRPTATAPTPARSVKVALTCCSSADLGVCDVRAMHAVLNWTDFIEHTCSLEGLNFWINYTIQTMIQTINRWQRSRDKNVHKIKYTIII